MKRVNRALLPKARAVDHKRSYTSGSELSVRERLNRFQKETSTSLDVVRKLCTALSHQCEDVAGMEDREAKLRSSARYKATRIINELVRLEKEQKLILSKLDIDYDRHIGAMMAGMDQVQRCNPTYLDLAGLVTNPNQAVLAKKAKLIQEGRYGTGKKKAKPR